MQIDEKIKNFRVRGFFTKKNPNVNLLGFSML
jgi:hypothetical protein